MAWARLDDGILDHPKILRAGEDAAAIFIKSIIYCCKHLTDGMVPKEALSRLTSKPDAEALVQRLLDVELWYDKGEKGWEIHDFGDWNPTRKSVKDKRAQNAERQRKHREKKAQEKAEKEAARDAKEDVHVTKDVTRYETRDKRVSNSVPSHPIPSPLKIPPSPQNGGTPGGDPPDEVTAVAGRVLMRINELAGTTYTSSPDLEARIREGVSEGDLMAVVESQWGRDFMREKPSNFRPRTLFGAKNFAEYLGGASAKPKPEIPDRAPGTERYFS